MMLPFNFHHLFYFYTIACEGSISNASRHLRVSQPALSAQLKRFEDYLDVELFNREGNNLVLTNRGRMVMAYAKTIFNTGQELQDNLRDIKKNGRTHMRVGVATFSPKACTTSLLSFFMTREPNVHIALEENKLDVLVEKLGDHALDVIIGDLPAPSRMGSMIQNTIVQKLPIMFCAHRELAEKYGKLPKGLNDAPLIMPPSISPIHSAIQDYLLTHKVKPHIVGEIEDPEIVGRMILQKKGIAAMNSYTIYNTPWREEVVPFGKKLELEDTIYLITKKRKKPIPLLEQALKNFKLKLPSGQQQL